MRALQLNAFAMNCVGHQSPGLWTHPADRSTDYTSLAHWTALARLLERGLFDGIFLADVLGPSDVHGGSAAAAIRAGIQIPANDPLLLIPAMAAVTAHLGFGVTVSASYEPPFLLARRFATLDHLTGGRIAWNIVTSYLDSAARAAGHARQMAHDDRYRAADDVMALAYKLWEGSWEEGAVVADRARGLYADPARVHAVRHGDVDTVALWEPSPQRTPVLYQAGSSPAGIAFAARHAECVFVSGPSAAVLAPRVATLRAAVAAAGREVRVFALVTAIVAPTDAQAHALLASYRDHVSLEGALALLGGWTGLDFAGLAPDTELRHVENDAGRTALVNFTRADPNRRWTVREVAEHVAIGGAGPVIAGSAATVAGALLDFAARTGVDGFNLSYAIMPGDFERVVDLLVPELQSRGAYKTAYRSGTLREKLFGAGRLVELPHPAAGARRTRGSAL